jgi:hypothetical protein
MPCDAGTLRHDRTEWIYKRDFNCITVRNFVLSRDGTVMASASCGLSRRAAATVPPVLAPGGQSGQYTSALREEPEVGIGKFDLCF